jgi:predicted GNAT family N-acyltransferase
MKQLAKYKTTARNINTMENETTHDYINEGAQNGLRFILTQYGFNEKTHYFFSNGLIFMNENHQEDMLNAIGDFMVKNPPHPEYLE